MLTVLRLARRGDLGRLVVMLELVVLKKLEFAARRKVVGNALRKRCEYGKALVGKGSC